MKTSRPPIAVAASLLCLLIKSTVSEDAGSTAFTLPAAYELSIVDDPGEACRRGWPSVRENVSLCFSPLEPGKGAAIPGEARAMYTVISDHSSSSQTTDSQTVLNLRIRRTMLVSPDAGLRLGMEEALPVAARAHILGQLPHHYNGDGVASESANGSRSKLHLTGELQGGVFEVMVSYQDIPRSHAISCVHPAALDSDFYLTDSCHTCSLATFHAYYPPIPLGWRQDGSPLCGDRVSAATKRPAGEREILYAASRRQGFPRIDDLPFPSFQQTPAAPSTPAADANASSGQSLAVQTDASHLPDEENNRPPVNVELTAFNLSSVPGQAAVGDHKRAALARDKLLISDSDGLLDVGVSGLSAQNVVAANATTATLVQEHTTDNEISGTNQDVNLGKEIVRVYSKGHSALVRGIDTIIKREEVNREVSAVETKTSTSEATGGVRAVRTKAGGATLDNDRVIPPGNGRSRQRAERSASLHNADPTGVLREIFPSWLTKLKETKISSDTFANAVTDFQSQKEKFRETSINAITANANDKSPHSNWRLRTLLAYLGNSKGKTLNTKNKDSELNVGPRPKSNIEELSDAKSKMKSVQNISENAHQMFTKMKMTRMPGGNSWNPSRKSNFARQSLVGQGDPSQLTSRTAPTPNLRSRPEAIGETAEHSDIAYRLARIVIDLKARLAKRNLSKRASHRRHHADSSDVGGNRRRRRHSAAAGREKPPRQETVSCSLHLVADHLFFSEMGDRNPAKTVNLMVSAVNGADAVFRATDFDGDGRGDNVGFVVKNITIIHNASAAFYRYSRTDGNALHYLGNFSTVDFSHVCLALAFTAIEFHQGVVGLAWYASALVGDHSGICGRRVYLASESGSFSFNTALVTFLNRGSLVHMENAILTLVHELGHCFGSRHDDVTGSPCNTQNTEGGDFLMQSYRPAQDQGRNSYSFSPCSVDQMLPVIQRKGSCFLRYDAVSSCGNGLLEVLFADCPPLFHFELIGEHTLGYQLNNNESVVNTRSRRHTEIESDSTSLKANPNSHFYECLKTLQLEIGINIGEECDCGMSGTCDFNDPCCSPGDAPESSPDPPCTFRRSQGMVCSFVTSPCCSQSCRLVSGQEGYVCRAAGECYGQAVCDGSRSLCPPSALHPDGTACHGGVRVCSSGNCMNSLCVKAGLKDCFCKEREEDQCKLCCQHQGQCLPARSFNVTGRGGGDLYLQEGDGCLDYRAVCRTRAQDPGPSSEEASGRGSQTGGVSRYCYTKSGGLDGYFSAQLDRPPRVTAERKQERSSSRTWLSALLPPAVIGVLVVAVVCSYRKDRRWRQRLSSFRRRHPQQRHKHSDGLSRAAAETGKDAATRWREHAALSERRPSRGSNAAAVCDDVRSKLETLPRLHDRRRQLRQQERDQLHVRPYSQLAAAAAASPPLETQSACVYNGDSAGNSCYDGRLSFRSSKSLPTFLSGCRVELNVDDVLMSSKPQSRLRRLARSSGGFDFVSARTLQKSADHLPEYTLEKVLVTKFDRRRLKVRATCSPLSRSKFSSRKAENRRPESQFSNHAEMARPLRLCKFSKTTRWPQYENLDRSLKSRDHERSHDPSVVVADHDDTENRVFAVYKNAWAKWQQVRQSMAYNPPCRPKRHGRAHQHEKAADPEFSNEDSGHCVLSQLRCEAALTNLNRPSRGPGHPCPQGRYFCPSPCSTLPTERRSMSTLQCPDRRRWNTLA